MPPPSLPLLSCRCVPLPPDDEEVDDGVIDSLLVGPLLLPTPEGLAATEICRLLVLSWPPPYDGDGEMRGPDRGEPDREGEPLPSDLPDDDEDDDELSANAAEATGGGGEGVCILLTESLGSTFDKPAVAVGVGVLVVDRGPIGGEGSINGRDETCIGEERIGLLEAPRCECRGGCWDGGCCCCCDCCCC